MPSFSVSPVFRTWAEIDPSALRHNLSVVRARVGAAPGILAVVKANAYGHGAVEVVKALADQVRIFGVANIAEADEVESVGTGREVMILSPCLPAEYREAVERGFVVTVSSAAEAAALAAIGPARINFKVDTGMGRAGVWWEHAESELRGIAGLAGITVHSLSTHLPAPDEDEEFTRSQLEHFRGLTGVLRGGAAGVLVHSLNSAGILRFPEFAGDIVRAGLVLYGVSPVPDYQDLLRPALAWKSRVTLVRDLPKGAGVSYGRTFIAPKDLRIGLLAIGYADGYPRHLSGRGASVLIGGKACPILGRVTMDQVVVDLSASPETLSGDEVVLVGRQGRAEITATELAARAGTISWDLLTGISNRVVRIFPDAAA
jgi:alanine racemase